jgi:integrase
VEHWLAEANDSTRDRYAAIAEQFATFLGANEQKPLISEVSTEHVREYLHSRRKTCSASTTNLERKILSVFFRRAIKNQQLRENPVFPVVPFNAKEGEAAAKRRPFTLEELRLMYRKAPSDFWRYMIVGGTYTGLRMGDLISLSWPSIDFAENMIRVKAAKTRNTTGKTVNVPIAEPFQAILTELWDRAGKPKTGHVWPEQAAEYDAKGAGQFSNEFYDEILTPCGFVHPRENKKAKGKGRAAERSINPVSFHSFRHSFVTLLKATGGSQIVAKELAGHSSDLISDTYTSLPADVLTKAIDALPRLEAR